MFVVPSMGNGQYLNGSGVLTGFSRGGFLTPAVNIDTTHFWGFTRFLCLNYDGGIKFGKDDEQNSVRLGTFTGLRVSFSLK